MTNATTKTANRGFVVLAIAVAVLLLAVALGSVVGCSPKQAGDGEAPAKQSQKEDPMATQTVDWTMDIDCKTCHTTEAGTMTDAAYPQAMEHGDMQCSQCHTEEATLKTAHEGVTYADKPASKATVVTVDAQTCQDPACHGTLADMAVITADNTNFKDDKGAVQNPHEYASNEQHDANVPTCTDCHKIHTKNVQKDAMKWCAQCHHQGVFQCGTCHELRERQVA
ncbi:MULTISPECIES: cytochrome c3 family protein [Gordonibacter]|uniref:Cytochrome c3 family protein n=1 Tax=Gordonibacter faecis TaxID=3047475 RepID=A0ABT7DQA9_9ACTN|nr:MULTISPECIES: cytochrome c3 family protein [unclassified Gordonibacter]MDJ1651407.1 cytochrome c3 family protein [Gordonibacter sp. KGMB12511]HIW76000.1 cytochrome c3 family protein [Candidatus Gordonibacter avicola]